MEKLLLTVAYKYVALALMMAEANQALEQLQIPGWNPVTISNVSSYHVSPPRLRVGGSIDTQTHLFGFGLEGRLLFIQKRVPEPGLTLDEHFAKWSGLKSLVGSNEAYVLASNWLVKLDVDVMALETVHPPAVAQAFNLLPGPGPNGQVKALLPQFDVTWGTNTSQAAVSVSIFGPTMEPIHIRQNDSSFSRRPRGIVKNAERLLNIADADFATYDLVQRSNLVAMSAVARYPRFDLPLASTPKPTRPINSAPNVPLGKPLKTLEPSVPVPK